MEVRERGTGLLWLFVVLGVVGGRVRLVGVAFVMYICICERGGCGFCNFSRNDR